MKKIISLLCTAVVVASVLAQASVSALPNDPSFRGTTGYGLNLQGMNPDPQVAAQQLAQASQELNLGYIRMDASWAATEPTKGNYNWVFLDTVVDLANKQGLRVLLIPQETPDWAREPGSTYKHAPTNVQDYADFVKTLVARYAPKGVLDYEIWNEPNIVEFWRDSVASPKPNAARYTQLLKATYTSAHSVRSEVNIIAGSFSPAGDQADGMRVSPSTFLQQMYDNGAHGYFDALSHHPYSYPVLPSTDAQWNAWQYMSKTYGAQKSLRQLMQENGDSSKKIWLSEYGAPTNGQPDAVSDDQQAAMMKEAIQLHASYDWVGPMFFFAYKDSQPYGASTDRENYFGLYKSDGSQKAAVGAMQSVMPAPRALTASTSNKELQANMQIDAKPTFTGKANPYAAVTVTAHSDPVICTTIADSLGNWSCTLPESLPKGQHTVKVEAVNINGSIQTLGEYIVYVGAMPTQPITITSQTPKAPNTGNAHNLLVFAGLGLVALGVLAAGYIRRNM